MLENLFTNVFGRSKSKTSTRNQPNQPPVYIQSGSQMPQMPQMPQPPSLSYPPVAPYPPSHNQQPSPAYYPSLPFSNPEVGPGMSHYGTLAPSQISPLDSVPFEAKLTLNNSTNLVSLDQLFKEIKKAGDIVDRADAYLRSNQSDYDFKTEQGLIYQ